MPKVLMTIIIKRKMTDIQFLKQSKDFGGLCPKDYHVLAENFREEAYPVGTMIFREGMACGSLIIIKSGSVDIAKNGCCPNSQTYLGTRSSGEILCNLSIFKDELYPGDVIAKQDVSIIVLSRERFKEILKRRPVLGQQLICILFSKQHESDLKKISDLKNLDTHYGVKKECCKNRGDLEYERLAVRGDFAEEISHEMNNYLSVLTGNLELMKLDLEDKIYDSVEEKIDSIEKGLTRIIGFISALSHVPRPKMKFEKTDIGNFIEDELDFLGSKAAFRKINLNTQFEKGLPDVEIDPEQFRQMLNVILSNSANALLDNPEGNCKISIDLRFSSEEEKVILTITDNGCGMTAENYKNSFNRHFTPNETGHGFGLLAVKKIVKNHNGKIAASPAPGGGTIVEIRLPISQKPSPTRPKPVLA